MERKRGSRKRWREREVVERGGERERGRRREGESEVERGKEGGG